MLYENVWGNTRYIDIDREAIDGFDKWIPMDKNRETEWYFQNSRREDITSLKGLFAWQAYYFYHIDPYRFLGRYNLREEDFISDSSGKRIKPDVSHQVKCSETFIEVQQKKDDGKIWISSNWLYDPDCHASASTFMEAIGKAVHDAAGGDKERADELWGNFEGTIQADRQVYNRALERYFKGEKMTRENWFSEYVLAASRSWRIKDMEQLNEALEVEVVYFQKVLEKFVQWFRDGGLNLGDEAEEGLRRRIRGLYSRYPCDIAMDYCKGLVEEDSKERSDVYLWWGGEPSKDGCYALLTLYFEIDPEDIGTSRFDEKVSRNLKTIINIAEESVLLSTYKDIEPHVWKAIFS